MDETSDTQGVAAEQDADVGALKALGYDDYTVSCLLGRRHDFFCWAHIYDDKIVRFQTGGNPVGVDGGIYLDGVPEGVKVHRCIHSMKLVRGESLRTADAT